MFRLSNTLLDNLISAPPGQKNSLVEDNILEAKKVYNFYINVGAEVNYNLSIQRLAQSIAYYTSDITQLVPLAFFYAPTEPSNITFGVDSPAFAKNIIDLFGFTSTLNENINRSHINFIMYCASSLTQPISLGSASDTFTYVSFQNTNTGNPPSNRMPLFRQNDDSGTGVEVFVAPTDFTPGQEKITFSWSNP